MTQNIITKGIEKLIKTLYFLQQYGKSKESKKKKKEPKKT